MRIRGLACDVASILQIPCLGFEIAMAAPESSLLSLNHRWASTLAKWVQMNYSKPYNLYFIGYSYGTRFAYSLAQIFEAPEFSCLVSTLKVVSIDGAPHGPIAFTTGCPRSLFDIVLPQAEKKNTQQHDTMRYLANSTKAFCQAASPISCQIHHYAALQLVPGIWVQVAAGIEVRPIFSRGDEQACVIMWHAHRDKSTRFGFSDFSDSLDSLGHWYAAVWDRKHHRDIGRHLGCFSTSEQDTIEVPPGHSIVLRIHWGEDSEANVPVVLPRGATIDSDLQQAKQTHTY